MEILPRLKRIKTSCVIVNRDEGVYLLEVELPFVFHLLGLVRDHAHQSSISALIHS